LLSLKNGQVSGRYDRLPEATDRQIDAQIYELYGLTEEEIRIVEGTSDGVYALAGQQGYSMCQSHNSRHSECAVEKI
jgi:hypothetical protein